MLDPDIAKVFFKDQNGITTFINKLVDSKNCYIF